jgi:hypothetical protein
MSPAAAESIFDLLQSFIVLPSSNVAEENNTTAAGPGKGRRIESLFIYSWAGLDISFSLG